MFKYIIKKFKGLYIPFIVFELIFVSLRNILINLNIYNIENVSKIGSINDLIVILKQIMTFNYTGDSMIGAIWFLRVLFYVSILYSIFNKFYKKIIKNNDYLKSLILIVISVISFNLIINGKNPSILLNPNGNKIPKLFIDILDSRTFILLVIFYLGNLYKKYKEKISINIYLALICFIGLYYNSRVGSIDVSTYVFTNPMYFILNAILGIYFNMYLAKKICNLKLKFNIIEYSGKFSLYIMMLHLLSCKIIDMFIVYTNDMSFNIISSYPVSFYGGIKWIIYTIVGVLVPISIGIGVNKMSEGIRKIYKKQIQYS